MGFENSPLFLPWALGALVGVAFFAGVTNGFAFGKGIPGSLVGLAF